MLWLLIYCLQISVIFALSWSLKNWAYSLEWRGVTVNFIITGYSCVKQKMCFWNCKNNQINNINNKKYGISFGPPLELCLIGAMKGLSHPCAQAASLQGQTALSIFMAGFTTRKWSFPRLWRQWRWWSGTMEGCSAQHEVLKTAKGCSFWEIDLHLFVGQPERNTIRVHKGQIFSPE